MRKVTIIGHFAHGIEYLDGQTIKTKVIAEELRRQLSSDEVGKIDTHGGIKTLLKAPFQIFFVLRKSKNVIILPAHNGVRVYAPLLVLERHLFRNRKLHYVVIGGWLPKFLEKHKITRKSLKAFNTIYVETNTMKRALKKQNFTNVRVMPNCKKLKILSERDWVYPNTEPYKVCTFSRVMKEKGIEDAINAVQVINNKAGRRVYELDIYGPIDSSQVEWFKNVQAALPSYVKYKGSVPPDRSVEVLKDYFLLIFPTRFFTEGIPGTIIDAYAAGVPVVSSKWESFSDLIDEGVTGEGYAFGKVDALVSVLEKIQKNPQVIICMKQNCVNRACNYTPEKALNSLIKGL